MIGRITAFVYGAACYVIFLVTFLYAVGFLGNFGVPKSIDSGRTTALGEALAVNAALLGLFAMQHSLMARQWFKKAWTRIVPVSVERSTYVLFSSAALLLLFWKWEPMGGVIWSVENSFRRMALWALFAGGWMLVLLATCLIDHFELFGMRQVWCNLLGREYKPTGFRTPWLYRYVRHPLYVGWLMVFWSAPRMTVAHLVFAVATTAYIFAAIQLEEQDLLRMHKEYSAYRREVPMIVPTASARKSQNAALRQEAAKQSG